MPEIEMKAKFAGKCSDCGYKFPQGTQIKFDPDKRTAKHKECPQPDYSGTEQKNIFDMWVQLGQETARMREGLNGNKADI